MEILPHHIKSDICLTRPKYREGKVLKSVKAYTCSQESKYIIATNVPSIGVHKQLLNLFAIYGMIEENKMLDEYPCASFCETMLIKFAKIQHARTAKIKLDNYNFYGGNLHVFYAPEFESVSEVREKLEDRKAVIREKCLRYDAMKFGTLEYERSQAREPLKKAKKPKKANKAKNMNTNKNALKKDNASDGGKSTELSNVFIGPQIPQSLAQSSRIDSSYQQSIQRINEQLDVTQTHQQDVNLMAKKRRKIAIK